MSMPQFLLSEDFWTSDRFDRKKETYEQVEISQRLFSQWMTFFREFNEKTREFQLKIIVSSFFLSFQHFLINLKHFFLLFWSFRFFLRKPYHF